MIFWSEIKKRKTVTERVLNLVPVEGEAKPRGETEGLKIMLTSYNFSPTRDPCLTFRRSHAEQEICIPLSGEQYSKLAAYFVDRP